MGSVFDGTTYDSLHGYPIILHPVRDVLIRLIYADYLNGQRYINTSTGLVENLNENSVAAGSNNGVMSISAQNWAAYNWHNSVIPFIEQFRTVKQDIISAVDNAGTVTVTVDKAGLLYLEDGDTVQIAGADYVVANVTDTTFEVQATITAAWQTAVWHPFEVVQRPYHKLQIGFFLTDRGLNIIVPDVVEAFILNGLDLTEDVIMASSDGITTSLFVGALLHIREGMTVVVDGVTAPVSGVNASLKRINVLGDFPDAKQVTYQPPFFFHGTPYATNSHLSHLNDINKVPMIYLMEIINERFGGPESRGLTVDLRLFFLDVANFSDWMTDDHYSNVIIPMRALAARFVNGLTDSRRYFATDNGGRLVNHAKFGVFQNYKGHLNSLFNDRLSGVELYIEAQINNCS